jgi:hypothetical protein
MNDLIQVRKKIKEVIVKSGNVPIMAEDFIGPGRVSTMIEKKYNRLP